MSIPRALFGANPESLLSFHWHLANWRVELCPQLWQPIRRYRISPILAFLPWMCWQRLQVRSWRSSSGSQKVPLQGLRYQSSIWVEDMLPEDYIFIVVGGEQQQWCCWICHDDVFFCEIADMRGEKILPGNNIWIHFDVHDVRWRTRPWPRAFDGTGGNINVVSFILLFLVKRKVTAIYSYIISLYENTSSCHWRRSVVFQSNIGHCLSCTSKRPYVVAFSPLDLPYWLLLVSLQWR